MDDDTPQVCNNTKSDDVSEEEQKDTANDTSSSDDEDMDDEEYNTQYRKLDDVNSRLAEQPNSYDLLIEKIEILQKLGELKDLRTARESLSKSYPLSPDLWMSWIKDEMNLVTDLEGKQDIINLFERALKDYQSIKIWLPYLQYVKDMGDEKEIAEVRIIFERAVAAVGLHMQEGREIWEMYRDFELDGVGGSSVEQKSRCSNLCNRQLAIPLTGMDVSFEVYNSLFPLDDAAKNNYESALEMLSKLQVWEDKLVSSKNSSAVYNEYIQYEKDEKSKPARIICLYERAVCDNPLDGFLWLDFINYASNVLQIGPVTLEISERASRNCQWNGSIWIQRLLETEKFTPEKDKMREILESSLVYCTNGDQAGDLWLKYIQFLRRRIKFEEIVEDDMELFMKTISAAEEYLVQFQPEPRDYIGEILFYGIRTLAHSSKSMAKARKLWFQALHKGYGQQFKLWLQYFQLEQRYGDINSNRKCLEKATSVMTDGLDIIAELWINFERDFGDLKSMKHAEEKIAEFLNKKYQDELLSNGPYKKSKNQKRKEKRLSTTSATEAAGENKANNYEGRRPKKFAKSNAIQRNKNKIPLPPKPLPPRQENATQRRPPKSFVPRSLQSQHKPTPESESNPTGQPVTTKNRKRPSDTLLDEGADVFKKPMMSNADFKNFFKTS